jgi:hypothetical protein
VGFSSAIPIPRLLDFVESCLAKLRAAPELRWEIFKMAMEWKNKHKLYLYPTTLMKSE